MKFYKIVYYCYATNETLTMGVTAESLVEACRIFEKHFDDMDCPVDISTGERGVHMLQCVYDEQYKNMVLSQCKFY